MPISLLDFPRRAIQLTKERAELKIIKPPIDVVVELAAYDKNGKVERRRRFRSKSFLQNFIDIMLYGFMRPTGSTENVGVTGRDINGIYASALRASTGTYYGLPSPTITTGADIVVGTGSTAVATANYQMVGRAGQAQATLSAPITASLTRSFTVTATVGLATATTINETGIELPISINVALIRTYLIIRDIISGGFAVSAGGSIVVTYTISITS